MKPVHNESPRPHLLLQGSKAQPEDTFFGLLFDADQHLISLEELCCRSGEGALVNDSEWPVTELVERALQAQAVWVTVMHYSPSVEDCPMPVDFILKQGLIAAFEATDVTLLDYLLIGKGGSSLSLTDR